MTMINHAVPPSQQAVSASHPNEWTIACVRLADTILEVVRASSEGLQSELSGKGQAAECNVQSPPRYDRPVVAGVRKVTTAHHLPQPGTHVIKVGMIDPPVVLQPVTLRFSPPRPSIFGSSESERTP